MGSLARTLVLLGVSLAVATEARGQERSVARGAYFDAVASYFRLPPSEVTILADWEITPDEIPAILFVAAHAGVSAEALVALRRSGRGWSDLIARYGISAATLHVPVRDEAPTGALSGAYDAYRVTPVSEWPSIRLHDQDVVALVNVRVIAQTLGLAAEDVIRQTDSAPSYVELFAQLSR